MSKEKRKKVLRLSNQDLKDVINTIEFNFKKMDREEKRAVLLELGLSKTKIEGLSDLDMLKSVKDEYENILPKIDLNDFKVDKKYKTANEFMSRNKPKKLKEKIQKYKEL
tara:strand:+ start:1161 stop:1490 length:330 start_codon:yes stop_codon:yes gene_type:complete